MATSRRRRGSLARYTSPYSCAVKQKERVPPQAAEGAAIEELLKGSAGAPRRGGAHRKSRNTDVAVERDATRVDWCVEIARRRMGARIVSATTQPRRVCRRFGMDGRAETTRVGPTSPTQMSSAW